MRNIIPAVCLLLTLTARPSQGSDDHHSTGSAAAIDQSPTATPESPVVVGGSCHGQRSDVIDHDYCHAVFPDRNCNENDFLDGPDGCEDTGDVLADCEATCAQAGGCYCRLEPHDCGDETALGGCWTAWCVAPEEPQYVGSCAFLTNEGSCESVTGCQWGPNTNDRFATQSTITSSSSGISVGGIVFIVVGSILGLVLLCGVVALVVMLAIKYQQQEKKPAAVPAVAEPDATDSKC